MNWPLRLPVPPSTNALYRNAKGRGRVHTKVYTAWIKEAGWELKLQRPQMYPRKVNVFIQCPRNGKRDLDNHAKAILDLLVEHRTILDDRHVEELRLKWHDDKECAAYVFVEVTWA